MTDYISRADAIDAVQKVCETIDKPCTDCTFFYDGCLAEKQIKALPSADAVHIHNDGTLEVKVSNAQKVGRVLVMDTDSHIGGGLFYPDDAVHGWRIGKPTEQGKYMVTLDSFGHKHIDLFYYGKPMMPNRKVRGNCWYRSDDEWGDVVYDDTDILAWQPLPKPYECGARMKGGAE